ncbi:MAG TPA: hypothetical protein VMR52_08075 [Dehalococcoidia bacterium]|nr:hypothetical protein [Dehalococcoidia bacterium]
MKDEGNTAAGFTYQVVASGDVKIFHGGTLATTLRGPAATNFLGKAAGASDAARQQLMARLTGDYKRGNERKARNHPRNR